MGARNEVAGGVTGSVVQATTINQVVIGRPDTVPLPRQSPAGVRDFVGRARELATLDALLDSPSATVAAVDGTAGVGKTTLVVRWAHRVQDRFPDGTLFANLRGHGPSAPLAPGLVLSSFLYALGIAEERIPADLDTQTTLYRSMLSGRRVLVLLDNAVSPEQVRPLLPAAPGSLAVVTSRRAMTGLVITEAAHRIPLGLLTDDESTAFVRGIVGARDIEPRDLVRACARLPLALRVAATHLAVRLVRHARAVLGGPTKAI
ncbi:NB-ARC domain-containing protein, partial [Actinokineospora diospyrosa]|uniref:NB-ARC domain-containing protein n=1 Tax=Actinokineospora diospyrosa TaxID=103728 RepID=UPI0031E0E117